MTIDNLIELVKIAGVPGVLLLGMMWWIRDYLRTHHTDALARENRLSTRLDTVEDYQRTQLTELIVSSHKSMNNFASLVATRPCLLQNSAPPAGVFRAPKES